MVLAEEILAAPELVDNLIGSINSLASVLKTTSIIIIGWVLFSAYRFWETRKEHLMLQKMNQDLKKIKRKLKVK